MKNAWFQPIIDDRVALHAWIDSLEQKDSLPLYTSVDIRNAGFKFSVVDTNLFPAGFNNLCRLGLESASFFLKEAISARVPGGSRILLVIEENTRNKWYLENVYTLEKMIQEAGFNVCIASFLGQEPDLCDEFGYLNLETAQHHVIKVHCLKHVMTCLDDQRCLFDLIILNNDLTAGIPDVLRRSNIPIYPSIQAGWHSRLKSHHFREAERVITAFSDRLSLDPWLFSSLFKSATIASIHSLFDRENLMDLASDLFKDIQLKYDEHGISEKPFIFLKSDSGTYGMGVLPLESPQDLLSLNRKDRNKLAVGKGSQVITKLILQEGIPSISSIRGHVSEVCIYQIANHFVGGFHRFHDAKTDRQSLNSQGMTFQKICESRSGCPYTAIPEGCGDGLDEYIEVYKILARLSGIAAHREILYLEDHV